MKLSVEFVPVILNCYVLPLHATATFSLEKATAPSVRNWYGIGEWLLEVSQRLRASTSRVCPPSVAFPNRKSIIYDNKLDFSGTKLAES